MTSLDIAWTLDVQRNSRDTDREPVMRILGPTFSGTVDSLARVLRTWAADRPDRRKARFWVCSGAATAVDKSSFERNCLPAQVTYATTVIPDEILLGELYRFLAQPRRPQRSHGAQASRWQARSARGGGIGLRLGRGQHLRDQRHE